MPGAVLDVSVPGRGHHQAVPGLHDPGLTALRDDPHELGVDRLLAAAVRQPALRLADDLRRHRDDVTVAQVGAFGDQRGQVVAGRHLGQSGHREDLQVLPHRRTASARVSAASAIAAVLVSSVIHNGTACT